MMDRVKDFFYNISDLLVALMIIAVVAYVISWKVGVISAYPMNASAEIITSSESELPDSDLDSDPLPDSDSNQEPTPNPEPTPDPEPEVTPDSDTEQEPEPEEEPGEKIKVVIPSGSLSPSIASILKEKGLIDSTSAFLNRAAERKLDVKLRAGTFHIPDNASLDEVINILTGR